MHTMVSDIPREKVSAAACNSAWCVGQAVRVMLQQARSPPPTPAAWPGVLSPCSLWHPVGSRRRLTLMQSAPNDLLEGAGEWCACGCGVGERGSALWRRRRARVTHARRHDTRSVADHARPEPRVIVIDPCRSGPAEPPRLQLAPPIRQTGNDYMRDSSLALLCSAAG